ncbi:MAG: T9SS type A sorting domain-containing protein [Candidatus Cloacimonetes bacterium]|nr:T9SS type A sorting domain-containing protein [Candidatus Cloacimonadota bacterium]
MKSRIIVILILFYTILLAQTPPDTLWTNTYGDANNDSSTCIRQTTDGGYIIVGNTDPDGNEMNDIWLIKTDENGNQVWDAIFGGDQNDFSIIGQQTSDGGFIIIGTTESFGIGMQDFWLIKTDENGNEEWNQTYGSIENDRAQYVEQTADGGFILTGGTGNLEDDHQDFWLIKTDEYGNMEWEQTYGGTGNEKAYTVHQNPDGSYILSGLTESFGNGAFDMWLIKTDEFGNELWNRTFGGTENENAYSMQILPNGGYILAGVTKSYGQGDYDVWLIEVDSLGFEIWNETYGTPQVDYCYSVDITSDGNYVLGGLTNSTPNSDFDVLAIKVSDQGEELWTAKVGGSLNDFAIFVEQTDDGGYILTGYSNSFGNGDNDIYAVKLDADNINSSDEIFNKPSGLNFLNYPNPFNPSTTISFDLITKDVQDAKLEIYNLKGQKIRQYSIFNDQSSIIWDGTDEARNRVSSGIYFSVLKNNGNTLTSKKMLLFK